MRKRLARLRRCRAFAIHLELGQRCSYRPRLAGGDLDAHQAALEWGGDLSVHLVRDDLDDRLVAPDHVAFLLEPAVDRTFGDRFTKLRHLKRGKTHLVIRRGLSTISVRATDPFKGGGEWRVDSASASAPTRTCHGTRTSSAGSFSSRSASRARGFVITSSSQAGQTGPISNHGRCSPASRRARRRSGSGCWSRRTRSAIHRSWPRWRSLSTTSPTAGSRLGWEPAGTSPSTRCSESRSPRRESW